jgi:hypothetical protein
LLKFGTYLLKGVGVACLEVLTGLTEVGDGLIVAEDVECLLQGLVFRHRDEHDVGTAVACDGGVVAWPEDPEGLAPLLPDIKE